jgi:hypothetical protein
MKKLSQAVAVVGLLLVLGLILHAQTQETYSTPSVYLDSQKLQLVPPGKVPFAGTFHLLSSQVDGEGKFSKPPWPPFPFDPYDGALPIYAFDRASGEFLIADSPEDFEALQELNRQTKAWSSLDEGEGEPSFSREYTPAELWLEVAVTNAQARFIIHSPETNAVYDLFGTTNLNPVTNLDVANWVWLLRTSPGQTNIILTNLWPDAGFFILGTTNDSDGGGMTDAFERLVTHGQTNNSNDDRLTPLVSLVAADSVAREQNTSDTARFVVSRLGGYLGYPFTVECRISGTATYGTDYTLSPTASSATNIFVTIPAGFSSTQIVLTAIPDSTIEGTETATLTLVTNANWTVNPAASSATAWILEEYTKVYTTVADFNLGVMAGLESVLGAGNGQLQFQTNLPPQFPFINVACSARGTVARINTTNGVVIGEYLTAPAPTGLLLPPSPSRTTVDQYGNVWVANREDNLSINGVFHGSITRIGLIVGGTRHTKTNGVYVPDANGQYVSLSNASYNTCIDRDGDGFIRTSRGLGDILPWTNERGYIQNVDSYGGVSTAEDEAILQYTRVLCTGTRTIAVDKFNDIWVGGTGGNQTHLKVNGLTGSVFPNSAFDATRGGYGGVIDSLGNLWSSWLFNGVMRLQPPNTFPVPSTNWQWMSSGGSAYGIAVDPLHPYIWQTAYDSYVFRWNTNGTIVTNVNGTVQTFDHGSSGAQGLTVDANGHVWVAHGSSSTTVGHLYTNGFRIGVVPLRLSGLRAEFYDNIEMTNDPVLVRADGPIDFDWGAGSPDPIVPTNHFSARWTGVLQTRVEGDHIFYVSADAGAGFRLSVNYATIIDNWDNPNPNAVELSGTNWLYADQSCDIVLEYKEFTGDARVTLSWKEPGASKEAIPRSQLKGPDLGYGPTGVSVDSFGKIWAANIGSSSAMRIDPNAGPIVLITNVVSGVTNIVTNHVGEVDMVVNLGSGVGPYNYSDMTGFNNRVVNPGLVPLKGYWTVIHDSGVTGEIWKKVSWNAFLTNGCTVEMFVRTHDSRQVLANEAFVQVFNNVPLSQVKGRYIEVRLGMSRPNSSENPLLYDLTLHGESSAFDGGFLDDAIVWETDDAWFFADVLGAEPLTYQWYVQHPWTNQFTLLAGETNATFVMTNVDSWVDGTWAAVQVTSANGETLWLGPAELWVVPLPITIPASGSSGAASRYPATINVFGQPTNLSTITVTLDFLSHGRPTDLDILLVSPSGKKIMLISDAGGSTAVTNTTLVFNASGSLPPETGAIGSHQTHSYRPSNYGDQETQLPGAPAGPYSTDFGGLTGDNPNGQWKLYIYDDASGSVGQVQYSWFLEFTYP